MKFTKPAWVGHKEASNLSDAPLESGKRLPIFSVHVHPDGSRIATGGMDAKVRIWSTKPILQEHAEKSGKPPKSLCTLTMHTGPVLTVRWAYSGRWLATGSDDMIVMIWDLDPSGGGKVWGSDEVNVEAWKPLKRLPGHESDVTDVAWAPNDRFLASVGLDSAVFVWCGYTLERLHRITSHQGFVKGVCWDPVGEFLATQSDDRSVKIWRTVDWGMEAEVTKPFEDSPGSTFFRRLSWSPDGAHITASNATNNKGFVFIAAVIARNTWTSEISLVGHENTVEVAAYNPHIFLRNPSQPVATANICSVVALGANDRAVSVWQTKTARPLIVAKEVFDRSIMDLSWSWDGLTLYAVSSDGTMGVFNFEKDELEGIAPFSAQESYLKKFGFVPPPLPKDYVHPSRDEDVPVRTQSPVKAESQGYAHLNGHGGGEVVNKLVAKRKPKADKRNGGRPPIPSAAVPSAAKPSSSRVPIHVNGKNVTTDGFGEMLRSSSSANLQLPTPRLNSASSNTSLLRTGSGSRSTGISPSITTDGFGFDDVDMDSAAPDYGVHSRMSSGGYNSGMNADGPDHHMDVPIVSLETNDGRRRKPAMDYAGDDARPGKPRTLGGDLPREKIAIRELIGGFQPSQRQGPAGFVESGMASSSALLPIPPLLTYVSAEGPGGTLVEGKNPEDDAPTEVMFSKGKNVEWLDYAPSQVLQVVATSVFCAAALQNGDVNVYSHNGRRLMPTLALGQPCSYLNGADASLMVLTSSGILYAWNVKKASAIFSPITVSPIFNSSPSSTILSTGIRPNGAPVIQLSTGTAFSYDPLLSSFVKLSEKWWMDGSDVWAGRQRSSAGSSARGAVGAIEQTIAEVAKESPDADHARERPKWWSDAVTLGHLEARMHAAKLLDSGGEYKQALLLYAQRVASEGFRGKAEELVKELFGPVYWRPSRDSDCWCPTVAGFQKRDLLREVLSVFARSKTLTKLAQDWQDILKRASNDD